MEKDPFYKAHWREIDADRMARYRDGFRWTPAAEQAYATAFFEAGQQIADFGCGPGHVAVELARRLGPDGHVYALDINADFLAQARDNAHEAGVADRVTPRACDGTNLPIADATLDRITARNTLVYVDDPLATLREFHRALRPGGLAHAVEGDWFLMAADPVSPEAWQVFARAAGHACATPDTGRKLHALFRNAGYVDLSIEVVANPDTDGRLLPMITNMAGYALESGHQDPAEIEDLVTTLRNALLDGTYFVVAPQFIVTGRRGGEDPTRG